MEFRVIGMRNDHDQFLDLSLPKHHFVLNMVHDSALVHKLRLNAILLFSFVIDNEGEEEYTAESNAKPPENVRGLFARASSARFAN